MANVLASRVLYGWADSAAADLARAEGLIDQALAASPRLALAHFAKDHVLRLRRRWQEASHEYQTALALDHNFMAASVNLGWCKLYAGSLDEVIPLVEQAIRLSPRDPDIGYCYSLIGTVRLLQSHFDDAIVWLEKARNDAHDAPFDRGRLAAAYALRGETERATAELDEARRLSSDDRYSSIARLKTFPGAWSGTPKDQRIVRGHLFRRPTQGRDARGVSDAPLIGQPGLGSLPAPRPAFDSLAPTGEIGELRPADLGLAISPHGRGVMSREGTS